MTQKDFILQVVKDLLKESTPDREFAKFVDGRDDSDSSDDLLSPAAKVVTPADRFVCKKEEEASISRSKKYK